nr:hypothetical protein [Tanacetum cinerariifolium]
MGDENSIHTLGDHSKPRHEGYRNTIELPLELLKESISQEDVNKKFLRSLPSEWNMHVVVWRNKPDLDSISMDDLYKNLKVYEPEVKGVSISSTNTQNKEFVSSSSNNNTNSSNEAVNTAFGVTTASTQKGLGYNAVSPPHTGLFMPPKPDLSYIGLEEFTSEPAVETLNAKTSEEVLKVVKKDNDAAIIKDWKSDDKDESVPQPKIEKKTVKPSVTKVEFVKPKQQSQNAMKPIKNVEKSRQSTNSKRGNMSYLTDYKEIDGGYLAFENSVLFNDTECVVLSPDFKLTDENHVLLRVPRKNNMYSVDLKNIIPTGGLLRFLLSTKDETSGILKSFITRIENLVDHKVNVIRCDNGTEFKNRDMNHFCEMKGIMRQYSATRTPRKNGVAERRNKILIEASRTMLADLKLPTTFWAEAVSTACYVQNRVLVVKPHNKTPYALFNGRTPMLSFMRPFGCHVIILNTIDHLGKFDGKAGEGFFVGYSLNSKAFRVFSSRTMIVKEALHIKFSENTHNNVGSRPNWLFDIDALTKTMNYQPVAAGTQSNGNTCTKDNNAEPKSSKMLDSNLLMMLERRLMKFQDKKMNAKIKRRRTVLTTLTELMLKSSIKLPDDPDMPELEDISIFKESNEDVFGAEADLNNLESTFQVSPIPTTRIHKDYPLVQVIKDMHSAPQTRRMSKNLEDHGLVSTVNQRTNHKDLQNYLFACFFITNGTQKDERGIVIRNKAILVAQGHTQEEGINYDEVFAPVTRIEAIRLFLAYASFKDFVEYQIDVKSAFHSGKIKEEVYVCQPLGFKDLVFFDKVYKVEKALMDCIKPQEHGMKPCQHTCWIMGFKEERLIRPFSSEGTKNKGGIFTSQDTYVVEILKKFGFSKVKTARTPMETQKPLLKNEDEEEVYVHIYRSMIGSLMYLIYSRPDIMFAVCACAIYQVNPKVSHLYAVKRIFTYLKGQPKLGLWYLKDSPFHLMAYTDSDYIGASLDRRSTTGGCQFLGCRLISWSCKKQTVVANSTTEAEYVATSSCCGQFWTIAKSKTINGEVQIHDLVDGMK